MPHQLDTPSATSETHKGEGAVERRGARLMRDLSRDTRFLAINTATIRAQWDLRQAIEGVARVGIPGIAPWRDQLQAMGVAAAAAAIRAHGLAVTGLCRGGPVTSFDRARPARALDGNPPAVGEGAALRAPCLGLVVGGPAPNSRRPQTR